MLPTYILARDHLQRAATILRGTDIRSQELRNIIERTIVLMDDFSLEPPRDRSADVLDLAAFRRERGQLD